jgi:hypothetical protein
MALDSDMDRPDNEEKTGTKGSNWSPLHQLFLTNFQIAAKKKV